MNTNCEGWLCKLAEDTMEKTMKTLSNRLDESEKELDDVDEIHHLWEIIRDVMTVKSMM